LATGTAFLPAPIAIGVLMLTLSARTIARFGPYRVLLAGLVLITGGMALLSRVPADGSYVADVLPAMLLLAAGFAAAMPAVTGLAMTGAREEDAGLASGLFNTTQVVGGSLGLAALTTLAASRTERLTRGGEGAVTAMADGYRLAFTVATGIALAALVLAAAILRPGRGHVPHISTARPAPLMTRLSSRNRS
jgi:MFS family permease